MLHQRISNGLAEGQVLHWGRLTMKRADYGRNKMKEVPGILRDGLQLNKRLQK